MNIHQSGEDYLETIYILDMRTHYVRSVDIAAHMGYTKPSVSRAMSILKTRGYITMADDGQINLTKAGLAKAREIFSKHQIIRDFLEKTLGVNKITAENDACRIEHVISEETYLRLKEFIENTK
ncbi:MAG: metal-dependent transcriptional regulator [Oscillospiraceae bacterium]|nr:metal-dependent transcriptional regulator [Oscillospiraceae bacterium]